MTIAEHIEHLLRTDGGFTVRVEILGDDHARTDALDEVVVADALVRDDAFVYMAAGGGRQHWDVIERSTWDDEDDGEAVLFPAHGHHRLMIGPIWNGEQRAVLEQWRTTPHDAVMPGLRELFEGLRWTPHEEDGRPLAPTEFRASWKSTLGADGQLHTAGALLLGPSGDLVYASLAAGRSDPFCADLAQARTRSTAPALFEHVIESGNGQSNEYSLPFTVRGPTIDYAAARLLTRLRFQGDPLAYVRELWLAARPDTVEYALEDAAAVAGVGDATRALGYLERLRGLSDAWASG